MKATITFDLNDPEDRAKHKLITHIDEITLTLWELDDYLRKVIKYDNDKSDDYRQAFCDFREVLREMLTEKGLTIDLMN
jgi:phosphopantothenate synthetase